MTSKLENKYRVVKYPGNGSALELDLLVVMERAMIGDFAAYLLWQDGADADVSRDALVAFIREELDLAVIDAMARVRGKVAVRKFQRKRGRETAVRAFPDVD
jgi:hypothetical protein